MYRVIKLSKEDQIALYMKLPKKQLAEMLYTCNELLDCFTNTPKPLNLQELERRLDNALYSESTESLTEYLNKQREKDGAK